MKRRRHIFAVLTVALGIAGAVFIIGAVDVAFRLYGASPLMYKFPKLASDVTIPPKDRKFKNVLPVHLPEPEFTALSFEPYEATNYFFNLPLLVYDPESGQTQLPNVSVLGSLLDQDGNSYVEFSIRTDEHSRRYTFDQNNKARKIPFLFLGCSLTFGVGVEEDETISSQAAKLNRKYRFLNYSSIGWGPNNILGHIRSGDFGVDLPRVEGSKAIYIYIDDHLNRIAPTLELYRYPGWARIIPGYYLDEGGELRFSGGMLASAYPFLDSLFGLLKHSALLRYFNVNWPLSYDHHHFLLTAKIIAEIRDQIRDRLGAEFYMVIYPREIRGRALIPFLEQYEIPVIDYSNIPIEQYMQVSPRLPDGHPSPAAYEFLARQLIRDLEL